MYSPIDYKEFMSSYPLVLEGEYVLTFLLE